MDFYLFRFCHFHFNFAGFKTCQSYLMTHLKAWRPSTASGSMEQTSHRCRSEPWVAPDWPSSSSTVTTSIQFLANISAVWFTVQSFEPFTLFPTRSGLLDWMHSTILLVSKNCLWGTTCSRLCLPPFCLLYHHICINLFYSKSMPRYFFTFK